MERNPNKIQESIIYKSNDILGNFSQLNTKIEEIKQLPQWIQEVVAQ